LHDVAAFLLAASPNAQREAKFLIFSATTYRGTNIWFAMIVRGVRWHTMLKGFTSRPQCHDCLLLRARNRSNE
jgi:hypothetical protein